MATKDYVSETVFQTKAEQWRNKALQNAKAYKENNWDDAPFFDQVVEDLSAPQGLNVTTWLSLLPGGSTPAITGTDGRNAMTHDDLRAFLSDHEGGDLRAFGLKQTDVLCSALPNGPEAICVFLAMPLQCVYAPLHHDLNEKEAAHKIKILEAKAIVVHADDQDIGARRAALKLGIAVIELTPDKKAGKYTLKVVRPGSLNSSGTVGHNVVKKEDEAVVLLTSGSTGDPKAVPIRHEQLWASAFIRAALFNFKRTDVCMNILPLYHLHGIRVNALPILVAGGTVLCTKGFGGKGLETPDTVVGILTNPKYKVTFYSAVPTVHQLILLAAEGKAEQMGSKAFKDSVSLRIVSSGSASLPTETAKRLSEVFGCATSIFYALTEMQPEIYEVPGTPQKPGSVGRAWGVHMRVGHVNADSDIGDKHGHIQFCTNPEEVGEVLLKSRASAMRGYKNTDRDEFVDGWFRTGDMGKIDADGCLFLTGRSKEVINRGGETISPFEIENEAICHPDVREAMAFSARHPLLQETVGLVITTDKQGDERPTLNELNRELKKTLHSSKLPQVLVYMEDLPKSGTAKLLRIKYAERCSLPEWDPQSLHRNTYEAIAIPNGTPLDAPITCYPADGEPPPEDDDGEMVDSLGFVVQRGTVNKDLNAMELRVRDNCYPIFVTGILIDHYFDCFFYTQFSSTRVCRHIHGIEPLGSVLTIFGDSKCQLGMVMVAGYFHAMKGRGFTAFDAALALVYLMMNFWYPMMLELIKVIAGYDESNDWYTRYIFAIPRWFLLCFLFPRALTGGMDLINQLVSRCSPQVGKTMEMILPWLEILFFLVFGLFWRGTGNEFCNSMPDWLGDLVCYTYWGKEGPGQKIFYSEVCMMSAMYLISFFSSGMLVNAAWHSEWALHLSGSWKLPQWSQKVGGPKKLKYSKVIAFVFCCLYLLSCCFYNRLREQGFASGLNFPIAKFDGNMWEADENTLIILGDWSFQTLQAFMLAVAMSQAPFQLSQFAASTLGAFVNQMITSWVLNWAGVYFLLFRIAGVTPPPGTDGIVWSKPEIAMGYQWSWGAEAMAFITQLFLVFGILFLYWLAAVWFFHPWTMLPFNLPIWIYSWLRDCFSPSDTKDTESESANGVGAGSAHTEKTPLLEGIVTKS